MKDMSVLLELKRMAWRSLARHKVKTIITVLAIMVSVSMFIFLDSWISGMSIESRRNIVNYETGAAKLQTKLYFEKKDELPSYENFTAWEDYSRVLDSAGYNSAPRFVFSGTILSSIGSAPILFNAVNPEAEAKVLSYTEYMESGRYIQSGAFEIVLGTMAAEKLKVGIPQRIEKKELAELASAISGNTDEEIFILSLYTELEKGLAFFDVGEASEQRAETLVLKNDIPQSDLNRYWNMLAASGRNDVRISAVIDMKAAPESIRPNAWEGELLPALTVDEIHLLQTAYQYDELIDAYLLSEEAEADEVLMTAVTSTMIRSGFSGAVRHVNQLFSAVVVGVINSPDPVTNANIAYLPMDVLQGEEGMMLEGRITELLIREKNASEAVLPAENESAAQLAAVLEKGLTSPLPSELQVFSWLDYIADYAGYESLENGATKALSGILFLLSFLVISNTVLLGILERTKEIGMMRALGMTDRELIMVYMLESGFIGLLGSLLGIALGCLLVAPMVKYGMDISAMSDAMGGGVGYRVASRFRAMWNFPIIIGSGAAATIISAIAAYFPVRNALKMPITNSLRFE
jgi:ABC-type lipoprotein release transport system permease subunit